MEATTGRTRAVWLALAATLLLAALIKEPCAKRFGNDYEYESFCYNDIVPLHSNRGLHNDTLPYVGDENETGPLVGRTGFFEYPVLTGLLAWSAAKAGTFQEQFLGTPETSAVFFWWNAAALSLLAALAAHTLFRLRPTGPPIASFVAAPALALYAFHNWDLLAVAFVALGWRSWEAGKVGAAGAWLGLGGAAKVYPLLFVPLLAVVLLRASDLDRHKRALRVVGCAAGAFVAVHVPFLLVDPQMTLAPYAFHATRGANLESLWYVLGFWARMIGLGEVRGFGTHPAAAVALALGAVLALSSVIQVTTRRRLAPEKAALALLVVFVLANKVFSLQYALWILPFLVLAQVPWRRVAIFAATDVAAFLAVFFALPAFGTPAFDARYAIASVAIVSRAAALGAIGWWASRTSPPDSLNGAESFAGR